MKSKSQKHLDDAIAELEDSNRQLFSAQSNLGYIRYLLEKSKFPLEPVVPERARCVFEVNKGESQFPL